MGCCRVVTTTQGCIGYGIFLASWVGAISIVPGILAAFVLSRGASPYSWLMLALVVYYVFRWLVPARRWPALHSALARATQSKAGTYFRQQLTVVEDTVPPKNGKTLLAFHPHGVLCCGWSINGCMGTELLDSEVSWLGTGALFKLPVISDMLTWYGGAPAEKESFVGLMKRGANICVLPGGFEEATIFKHGKHRIYLRKRRGFIKYALQHGYTLQPVYTFGEESTYWTLPGLERIGLWVNKYKIPAVVALGKYFFMPNDDVSLVTVIGKRMPLPTIASPTRADVQNWHTKYIQAVQELFDKHKAKYAAQGEAAVLEVW